MPDEYPDRPPRPPASAFFLAAAFCAVAAFCLAILYGYVLARSVDWPWVLARLCNGIGSLVFVGAAASAWCLALGVWFESGRVSSREQQLTFYGALGLVVVLLVMGMQFLVIGEWRLLSPWSYSALKYGSYLALVVYLYVSWMRLRREGK